MAAVVRHSVSCVPSRDAFSCWWQLSGEVLEAVRGLTTLLQETRESSNRTEAQVQTLKHTLEDSRLVLSVINSALVCQNECRNINASRASAGAEHC